MPNAQQIALTPPSLSPGYCFTTWQQLAIDLFSGAFGTIPSNVGLGYNIGQAIPGVNDSDKPWIKLNPDNSLNGEFVFAFGTWVRPYPVPPGPSSYRAIWVGTLPDLFNYDGGDGIDPTVTPPGPTTGSFWEVDHVFDYRTIVGPGTLPISGTILAIGALGGLEKVSLALAEMPPHTHQTVADQQTGQPNNISWGSDGLGGGGGVGTTGTVYPGNDGLQSGAGSSYRPVKTSLANSGGDTSVTPVVVKPHDNMQPYVVAAVIKRTVRAHITI